MIKGSFLLALLLSPLLTFAADHIVLKEGKTISGTITGENAEEVSIKTGPNMYLRIERSKIREIKRATKTPTRPSVRLDQLKPETTAHAAAPVAVAASTPAAAAPAVATERPDIMHMKPQIRHTTQKVGAIEVIDTMNHQIYEVKAPQVAEARKAVSNTSWAVNWKGTAGQEGSNVRWKEGVIRSTITVRAPDWVPSSKQTDADVTAWNQYLKERGDFEAGRVKIYQEAVTSMATRLGQLEAANDKDLQLETESVITKTRELAEKRIQGYVRRSSQKK